MIDETNCCIVDISQKTVPNVTLSLQKMNDIKYNKKTHNGLPKHNYKCKQKNGKGTEIHNFNSDVLRSACTKHLLQSQCEYIISHNHPSDLISSTKYTINKNMLPEPSGIA